MIHGNLYNNIEHVAYGIVWLVLPLEELFSNTLVLADYGRDFNYTNLFFP